MEIKFTNVKYKKIFDNLNLKIKENQITSIVGKNGSGKTSIFKLIFGLDLNFTGEINVGKKLIHQKVKNKQLEIIRKDITYVSQDYKSQLFNINVFEDIKFSLNLDVLNENKLNELLKSFNLSIEILEKNYFELSDGELKKIMLIVAFIRNSKIILLDDPTSGLDSKSINSLVKLLKKEKRNGKLIIIASQDSEFLFNASDKILTIDNGMLIEQCDKYKFFEDQNILNKCGLNMPDIISFRERVLKSKNIKLVYRDNINDLIKDIYRSVK